MFKVFLKCLTCLNLFALLFCLGCYIRWALSYKYVWVARWGARHQTLGNENKLVLSFARKYESGLLSVYINISTWIYKFNWNVALASNNWYQVYAMRSDYVFIACIHDNITKYAKK